MIPKSVIFLVVLAAASAAAAQDKVTLRQDFAPGRYEVQASTASTMTTVQKETVRQRSDLDLLFDLEIKPADANGVKAVSMTFKRIQQKVSTNDRIRYQFDSNEPPDSKNTLAVALHAIRAAKISFDISRDGKLSRMTGLTEALDPLVKANSKFAPAMEEMKRQFGLSLVEKTLTDAAKSFPQTPVAVGDAWKNSSRNETPMIGEMKLNQDCKLSALADGPMGACAVVEYTSIGAIDQPKTSKVGSSHMTVDKAEVKQQVSMKIDTRTGLPLALKGTATTLMDAKMTDATGSLSTATITQEMTTEFTITPQRATASQPAK